MIGGESNNTKYLINKGKYLWIKVIRFPAQMVENEKFSNLKKA